MVFGVTTVIRPSAARPRAAIGGLLRSWRQTRRVSQLELSSVSGVSSRHLSFIETGRAKPSREMVLRLAVELDVPLRERNALLQAAGFAPEYSETPLDAPEMGICPTRRWCSTVAGTWCGPTTPSPCSRPAFRRI
jgi:transcriptional regulator with XRE-family HTH domain